jgi:hypothetical protein
VIHEETNVFRVDSLIWTDKRTLIRMDFRERNLKKYSFNEDKPQKRLYENNTIHQQRSE